MEETYVDHRVSGPPAASSSRAHRWVAVGLSAVLTIALAIAAASPARADVYHPDAIAYAVTFGVSLNEASRRLRLQSVVGDLEQALELSESATFAGIWIEHQPYRVITSFTRAGQSTIARHASGGPLAAVIEVRTARYSLASLRADLTRLADAPDGPFSAGINLSENAIEIETTSLAAFNEWAAVHGSAIPAHAKLKVVHALPSPVLDIYGGLGLSGCTSGFSVIDGGGTRGTTTAGHCGNSQSYQGNDLPFVSENVGGWSDVQWHTAPSLTVLNLIQEPYYPYTRSITSSTYWGSQTVGSTVCKYGNTSGYSCG
ncbi:MAG: S1 family peptidase, partial [bacterium]|nr:S1 family peptidase [bacterium]